MAIYEPAGISLPGRAESCRHEYMITHMFTSGYSILKTGGVRNGMIIAGHTPTIADDSIFYNDGEVFHFHDTEKDCIFYDIDCGCAFYETHPSGTLACLRVDDEEIFYL